MRPVCLVTGGQRGIGFGISTALAQAGFHVVIAALPHGDSKEAHDALKALAPHASYVQFDIAEARAADALVARIEADHGPIAALVNNAGIGAPVRADMLDMEPDHWDVVMDVNLRGTFFLTQAVARAMLARRAERYRSISFVTSVSAEMASPNRAQYCVSKAGLSMVAKIFAARLAGEGIGVFELRPGIIETNMTAQVRETYDAPIAEGLVPARRWGTPADIGSVIVPLATGTFHFATGTVIPVDGGLSIARL
ncbi:MAG: 3-ketoacyl-ACP reductase [Pseudomonadota bacterium]